MSFSNRDFTIALAKIFFIAVTCYVTPAYAQQTGQQFRVYADSVLAEKPSEETAEVLTTAYNIEFPEILKGNEEQSAEYVENFSERRRDYLIRMYAKGRKLLPKAAKILKKYDLPEELKVLMILESAYNANAVSKAGAVGYWQFMDIVAKEYGLKYVPRQQEEVAVIPTKSGKSKRVKMVMTKAQKKQQPTGIDERKNFEKATIAAARYLRDRKVNLDGNWLLVVASYNCGVGNVWKAMEKTKLNNPGFWDIKKYLPAETQAYVMNFIALNVVYHNYNKFLNNELDFTPVTIVQCSSPVMPVTNTAAVSCREATFR